MAWVVTVVLVAEAFVIAALNWFLGVVVDRQKMSLAGLDPDVMSTSSKIGGVVFGAYFVLCAVVALLVAIRDRAPAGFGRILLISVAVVHALLGAFAWGLVGWTAFLFMMVMLGLVVLLLMTYDRDGGPERAASGGAPEAGGDPETVTEPGVSAQVPSGAPSDAWGAPQDGDDVPQDSPPAQLIQPVPTTR
ncbi:hypothetical protein J2Z21_002324 [Streptomyces griseochromogenes]|uniref:Integral membrane protein n=1 Tax=Streptomyces griseochromogenes TaxID=68214 RepID=A0ABS4LPV1_9ACTN|nr:hypothetical protein [Streptomyces griseochromogenes]